MKQIGGNLVVLQGGGPTPVVNATLAAGIDEARRCGRFGRILGARNGVEGLIADDLRDLTDISESDLSLLRRSPGASLGSSRQKLADNHLDRIIQHLVARDIRALLMIGGNGSLRGADLIAQAVARQGKDICVIGIPKTIDNDIPGTDRCPGFASAARYAAQAVRDLGMDVRTLPQPVSIYETMGRGVGWLAGATVLAKLDESHAPHLVYLPEKLFHVEHFLRDVDRIVTRLGWAVVVVSEGIRNASGEPVFQSAEPSQRDALGRALPGGIAAHLADVVTRELKIRCRWEKPGLCGRSSLRHVAEQDLIDADAVGRAGVRAAIAGEHGTMVALRPLDGGGNATELLPLAHNSGERAIPADWLEAGDTAVGKPFIHYVRRLVGPLIDYAIPLRDHQ
jgi:6-phosphofructokinase 1